MATNIPTESGWLTFSSTRHILFENGRAVVIKDRYEGWRSFDEEDGDYFPWQEQYRTLERIRERNERKKKIRRMFGLSEIKPLKITRWTD